MKQSTHPRNGLATQREMCMHIRIHIYIYIYRIKYNTHIYIFTSHMHRTIHSRMLGIVFSKPSAHEMRMKK